jgi:hypothetical protein
MFRNLRVKRTRDKIVPDSDGLSGEDLNRDPGLPITLRQINGLPENARRRLYRNLLPPALLNQFGIDAINGKGPAGPDHITLRTEARTGVATLSVHSAGDLQDPFFSLELADNAFNGIDLNLLVLSDPGAPRFATDFDEDGNPTLFGTLRRVLDAEEQAKAAGLAPGQTRAGLRASQQVFQQLEAFLATLAHRAYFLEPLTYASAWVFERRGFAYVRGHKLMDEIQNEFQPGGRLYQALDGSNPFRQPDQWSTVRGRAWAIHDGILEVIDARWDGLRMIKQVGRTAGADTFPDAVY